MIHKILSRDSYASEEIFQREAKKSFVEVLKFQIKLIGLTVEDLEDPSTCRQYKIGRDDKQANDVLVQTARAMGITLVKLMIDNKQAVVYTADIEPDYSITKLYIQSMPQKPKDEQPQA